MEALGLIGAGLILVFVGFFFFVISSIILAYINQFHDINLFYYYDGMPLGIFALTAFIIIFLILIIYFTNKHAKKVIAKLEREKKI